MLGLMDKVNIEALEERLRVAMLQSNVAELDLLLSPQLMFTTFLGELISKHHDLEAHAKGHVQMHAISLTDSQTLQLGDVAVVTCCAEIDATFDGDRTFNLFRFTRVWAPGASGDYQVIAGQATLVYELS